MRSSVRRFIELLTPWENNTKSKMELNGKLLPPIKPSSIDTNGSEVADNVEFAMVATDGVNITDKTLDDYRNTHRLI